MFLATRCLFPRASIPRLLAGLGRVAPRRTALSPTALSIFGCGLATGPREDWSEKELEEIWERAGVEVRRRMEHAKLCEEILSAKTDAQRWLGYPWGRNPVGYFLDEEDSKPEPKYDGNELVWASFDENEEVVERMTKKYGDPLSMPEYRHLPFEDALRKMANDPRVWVETRDMRNDACAWGWCKNPWEHEKLCLASKGNYGVSWAHTHSRLGLWDMFGRDVWKRDSRGKIIGVREKAKKAPGTWGVDVSNFDVVDELYCGGCHDVYVILLQTADFVKGDTELLRMEGFPPVYF